MLCEMWPTPTKPTLSVENFLFRFVDVENAVILISKMMYHLSFAQSFIHEVSIISLENFVGLTCLLACISKSVLVTYGRFCGSGSQMVIGTRLVMTEIIQSMETFVPIIKLHYMDIKIYIFHKLVQVQESWDHASLLWEMFVIATSTSTIIQRRCTLHNCVKMFNLI